MVDAHRRHRIVGDHLHVEQRRHVRTRTGLFVPRHRAHHDGRGHTQSPGGSLRHLGGTVVPDVVHGDRRHRACDPRLGGPGEFRRSERDRLSPRAKRRQRHHVDHSRYDDVDDTVRERSRRRCHLFGDHVVRRQHLGDDSRSVVRLSRGGHQPGRFQRSFDGIGRSGQHGDVTDGRRRQHPSWTHLGPDADDRRSSGVGLPGRSLHRNVHGVERYLHGDDRRDRSSDVDHHRRVGAVLHGDRSRQRHHLHVPGAGRVRSVEPGGPGRHRGRHPGSERTSCRSVVELDGIVDQRVPELVGSGTDQW